MEICVLGSGSSGNCSALRLGSRILLIDIGFGPRTVAKRLHLTGARIDDVSAVILTHLDGDHFNANWFNTLLQRRIPVYCHERHIPHLYARPASTTGINARFLHRAGLLFHFDGQPFELPLPQPAAPPLLDSAIASSTAPESDDIPCRPLIRPLRFDHDAAGTIGFVIHHDGARLGYATDLGHVPPSLIDSMTDVDLLAIESNYDRDMQLASSRPLALKRRIMSGFGHLSNEQSLEAVRSVADRSARPPRHVVKLHLSRQCNDPAIVRRLYADHCDLAPRLCISSQTQPTPWLAVRGEHSPLANIQLKMFA